MMWCAADAVARTDYCKAWQGPESVWRGRIMLATPVESSAKTGMCEMCAPSLQRPSRHTWCQASQITSSDRPLRLMAVRLWVLPPWQLLALHALPRQEVQLKRLDTVH